MRHGLELLIGEVGTLDCGCSWPRTEVLSNAYEPPRRVAVCIYDDALRASQTSLQEEEPVICAALGQSFLIQRLDLFWNDIFHDFQGFTTISKLDELLFDDKQLLLDDTENRSLAKSMKIKHNADLSLDYVLNTPLTLYLIQSDYRIEPREL